MSKVRAIRDELEGTDPLYVRVARIRHLLKVPAVAEILDCSTRQVYVMIESGTLPSTRYCGSVKVDPYDLSVWLREHSTGRAAQAA